MYKITNELDFHLFLISNNQYMEWKEKTREGLMVRRGNGEGRCHR